MTERNRHLVEAANDVDHALSLLGEGRRREIVLALWSFPKKTATREELATALELERDQLERRVEPLVDEFVYEVEDGYKLLPSGNVLCLRALANTPPDGGSPSVETFDVGSACVTCGGTLVAAYETGVVTVECPDCDSTFYNLAFPPREAAKRSPADLLRAFDRQVRRKMTLAADGICAWCSGPIATEFVDASDEQALDVPVWVHHECERCGGFVDTTVGENVVDHPAVVSFYYDHDRDVTEIPCWELEFCLAHDAVTVRSTEPWRLELSVTLDGDELTLLVDENLDVVETRRTD